MGFVFDFLNRLFLTRVSDMNMLDIILSIVLAGIIIFFSKYVLKGLRYVLKKFFKMIFNIFRYNKIRCSKIQCPSCGRTLDKCVCSVNQKVSYGKRIKRYKSMRR